MKCWECKKETLSAVRVPYVAINQYTGEPYAEKFRDICPDCYYMIKAIRNKTGHVEVSGIRKTALKIKKGEK